MSVQNEHHVSSAALPGILTCNEKPAMHLGWLLVIVGFGGFLLWSLLAPLDKGVPVTGSVVVAGNRKAIQHQHGGIVDRLLVHDGDQVQAEQVLLTLNTIETQSERDTQLRQYQQLLVREARLLTEQQQGETLILTPALQQEMAQPAVAEIIKLQQRLMQSQQQVLQLELAGIGENITGLSGMLYAQQQATNSKQTQRTMLLEQLEGLRRLAKKGYIARNTLLDTEHRYAEVEADLAKTQGDISRIQHQILEQKLLGEQRQQAYQKEVHTQLTDVQANIDHVRSQLVKAKFMLANTKVRSPVAGTVVGMSIFTEGGVIAAGQKMMEIVPNDQPLLVDARVPIQLIDHVHPGMPVELQFTAFNQSTTPKVAGTVVMVSADRLLDEQTGEPYYLLQVQVSDENRKALNGLIIKPGMPVEGFVRTGERSLLNYLFKPLLDRLYMSLNEE